MRLESLANEILLDLFEYLNSSDLFYAFHNLNYRFKRLLRDHIRFHSLDFRSISKDYFDIICEQYLPSTIHQINSFYLSNGDETPDQTKLFLSYHFPLNQFQRLKSLTLHNITTQYMLNRIIVQCRDLQYLTHLNIMDEIIEIQDCDLIDNIWSLSKLTHCYINVRRICNYQCILIPVNPSPIQYLSLITLWNSKSLCNLAKYKPNLQYLNVNSDGSGRSSNKFLSEMIPSLITFQYAFSGNKQQLTNLLQKMPNLRNLKLEMTDTHLNGYDWEELFNNHLPNIKLFQFKMSWKSLNHIDEFFDSFQTPFWIDKHKWFVKYHWFPPTGFNLIYTVPYAFKIFDYLLKGYRTKSTCPNEEDYTYDCVEIIDNDSPDLSLYQIEPQFQFPNLERCQIEIFVNDKFQKYHSALNKLTTLCIMPCYYRSNYGNLNAIVCKAPRLSSIKFYTSDVIAKILQLTNTSIRSLDFTCGTPYNQPHFDRKMCVMLANSSLGRQCEFLSINVLNRIDILYLIKNMPKLRSLTVIGQAYLDPKIRRTLYKWLCDHLPSTYVITNRLNRFDYAELCIPVSARNSETRRSLCEHFQNWYSSI